MVEDHYESYFGQKDGLPRWFIRDINEGAIPKTSKFALITRKRMAHVNNKKKKEKASFAIEENVQDLISAFYYLRNFYDTSSLQEGEDIGLNMFF